MAGIRTLLDGALEALVVPSFTTIGFRARRRLFSWQDLASLRMDGRVALVTGGNSGIGFAAAERLASMGADVLVLARDRQRGERAVGAIRAATGAPARLYLADMSELASVRAVAREIAAAEPALDVLIHNAGALLPEHRTTSDGYEVTFAAMVLGPFALTAALRPMLERARGRVVWVSSGGMYTQRLDPETVQMGPEGFSGSVAYARAKRAQVVLSELWAERLRPDGVTVHAMHPGWAETAGIRASLPGFSRLVGPVLRSAAEGADTMVWLAAAPEAARTTGEFWLDRRTRSTHRLPRTGETEADRRELWAMVERLTAAPAGPRP